MMTFWSAPPFWFTGAKPIPPFTLTRLQDYPRAMTDEFPDLRQIEAFCAVMTAGSMTGGAKLLGRSQSMVTRLIRDLEISVGFPLFHRNGPRITPTDQGVRFYREAQGLLGSLNRLQENVRAIARNAESSLVVAATPALAAGLLARGIGCMSDHALPGRLHVQSASAQEVVHMVARKEAEFGLVSFPFNNPGVDLAWVGEADCVAAIHRDDPLASHDVIDIASLSGRRMLTMADPFRIRSRIEYALSNAGVEPAAIVDSNMAMVMFTLASRGLGVAILDPVTARTFLHPDLVVRPVNVGIPYFFSAVTPGGGAMSSTVAELSRILRREAPEMMPGLRLHDDDCAVMLEGDSFNGSGTVED